MRPMESFISQPIRSLQTMLRVIAEHDPRHETLIPDGIYGNATASSVSRFQNLHGLPTTGVTDQITWEAIVAEYDHALINVDQAWDVEIILNPNQVIRKGERHPHMHLVQGMLIVLSEVYASIPRPSQSGILDEPTSEAIAAFQQLNELPMTGNLDKHTWKHLALHYPLAANLQINRQDEPGKMLTNY